MNLRPNDSISASPSIAVVGGGISGLAAAYELARHGAGCSLFEASGRLGGVIETRRSRGFIIECGPDSWVTEKPWARDLAVELGLEDQILRSNDRQRRTYLVKDGEHAPRLVAIPGGMRLMVPVEWGPLLASRLFSREAQLAYLGEPGHAQELKRAARDRKDESVAEFVRRHFGEEVTRTIAGPLLAGVFGGDIETLSVRAVMPAFVKMEAEHGSLITAMRRHPQTSGAIFSTLERGLESLVERLVGAIPAGSLHLDQAVTRVGPETPPTRGDRWRLTTREGERVFDSIILATPSHVTGPLLSHLGEDGRRIAALLPQQSSSAIIVALAYDASRAAALRIPRGFGFLVPPPEPGKGLPAADERKLLACTFVDQKFTRRAPSGGVLLRAFFGGRSADDLLSEPDEALALRARQELGRIFRQPHQSPLPEPVETVVRRWPLSLPQYAVGHVERIAELESLTGHWPGLHLIGNAYHGVGLSDLIRDGRAAAQAVLQETW